TRRSSDLIEIEIEDFIDVPITIAQKVHENNSEKPWNEVNEHKVSNKKSKVKRRINHEAFKNMTYDQLCEIDKENEVEEWMNQISNIWRKTVLFYNLNFWHDNYTNVHLYFTFNYYCFYNYFIFCHH